MQEMDKTIKKIITALTFIGLTTKNHSIDDLLNLDFGDIDAIYKGSRASDTLIAKKELCVFN